MKSFRDQQNQRPDLQEQAERLAGMSPDQLTATLYREVTDAKAAGRLTDADLQRFCDSVAPLLTEEQNAKLRRLVAELT